MTGNRPGKDATVLHGEGTYQCPVTRKHSFSSRAKARRFIKQRVGQRVGSAGRDQLATFTARETYRCPHCDQWHIATPRRLDQRP